MTPSLRRDWLAAHDEPAMEPDMRIIDPHHHLWDIPGFHYTLDEVREDVEGGHNIVATVHVECRSMFRATGPELLRPLGETDYVNGIAAMSASGTYGKTQICAGIVGFAQLRRGAIARETLEGHMRIAGSRFKGIRMITAWDEDPVLSQGPYGENTPGVLLEPGFREGFAELVKLGLSYDAWMYYTQLDDLCSLAEAFPDATIIMNHTGGVLARGRYAGRRDEVFVAWKAAVTQLSRHENVFMKLGGLGGMEYMHRATPPPSDELARDWRPYFETCIELFGPDRCMFESNAPWDEISCTYNAGWNAFKKISAGASAEEKDKLFRLTAARAYRLNP